MCDSKIRCVVAGIFQVSLISSFAHEFEICFLRIDSNFRTHAKVDGALVHNIKDQLGLFVQ